MKKIIMLLMILIAGISLTGCSFFEEEILEIVAIDYELQDDGQTKITITYSDEDRLPDVFYIPRGLEGNGIKSIVTSDNKETDSKTLTITYTDESRDPIIFDLNNGTSIVGVSTIEEDGQTYMVINYSNNTKSDPIPLVKGEKGDKGDDGNAFKDCTIETQEDKSTIITFTFTKSEDVVITIPAPEQGNGVSSMIASEESGLYVITVNYTDGTKDTLKFSKPSDPNKWYSGHGKPDDKELGKNGDYYFDLSHKVIYLKENGIWVSIVSFEDNNEIYYITFNLNDDDSDVKASMSGPYNWPVYRNTYFTDNGYDAIPVPTREGYTFKGWYRSKVASVTSSPFTDFTPILSDLILYAHWEKNE